MLKINHYEFDYDKTLKYEFLNELIELCIDNKTNLLNYNNIKFSLIEKYVIDFVSYYLKTDNLDDYCIEFWCKKNVENTRLHIDCEEYYRKDNIFNYPYKSIVSYFNNNNSPTIITNINQEKYVNKDFKDGTLYFSLPKENKIIVFDGSYYHGVNYLNNNDCKDRYILIINIWKKKLEHLDYYESSKKEYYNEDIFTFIESNNILKINDCNILNYRLFNSILYEYKNVYPLFSKYIKDSIDNYYFSNEKNDCLDVQLKNKYGSLIDSIEEIYNKNFVLNRFYQRFQIKNVINKSIGKWIIEESENYASYYGWTTKRHNNYPTTDIPLINIVNIYPYFETLYETSIKKLIKESYQLDETIDFNINDIFIVKYDSKNQNFLEMHKDGSFISFNILLNDENDFEGGGTLFEDGLIMKPEQGDLIIHSSLIKHSGLEIRNGKRYLIVGFLNLKLIT